MKIRGKVPIIGAAAVAAALVGGTAFAMTGGGEPASVVEVVDAGSPEGDATPEPAPVEPAPAETATATAEPTVEPQPIVTAAPAPAPAPAPVEEQPVAKPEKPVASEPAVEQRVVRSGSGSSDPDAPPPPAPDIDDGPNGGGDYDNPSQP